MTRRLLCSIVFLITFLSVSAQSYKWTRGGATAQFFSSFNFEEELLFSCTDPNGNYYALSIIGNSAIIADTFNRPTGGFGSVKNVLFTSHNCNGQMRFAKLLSSNATTPCGIVSDGASRIYLAIDMPHFGSTSANTLRLGYDTSFSTLQYQSMALVQYDTVGDFGWIRFIGADVVSTYTGTGGTFNYVATDGLGNPHLVAGTKFGVQLTPTLTSHQGFYDHNFDAAGNLLDVKRLNLIDTTLFVYGIAIDKPSNKMYAHGYRDLIAFPGAARHNFLTALDVNRDRIWLDTFANPYYPGNVALGGIAADGYGHLYVTPNAGRCFVYRGDTTLNSAVTTGSSRVTAIMKLDTAGNRIWTRTFNATGGVNSLFGPTLMPNNKIAAGGVMAYKLITAHDTMTLYSGEGQNAYFTVVDSAGYVHTFNQLHGAGFYDIVRTLAADHKGNLFLGGKLESNVWAGSLAPYSSVGGDSDYFIMKYGVDCSCTSIPVANYAYSGTELSRIFAYTGTSAGLDSVRWTFGDGGTSTVLSPTHTYTAAGTYTTCVRIYSPCGNDMRCYEITAACSALPLAAYIDTGNMVRGFTYTGTTTAYYDSVRWSFGDGGFDTGLNVIHTYAGTGTYTVCAVIYTRCGSDTVCSSITVSPTSVSALDSYADNIKVYPNPAASSLNVAGITKPTHYHLLDAVGKSVEQGVFNTGLNTLELAQLPAGLYVLELHSNNGLRQVFRLMKQ